MRARSPSTTSRASRATPPSPSRSTTPARWPTRSSTSPRSAASRSSSRAGPTTRCPPSRRASAASARSATCWPRRRPATPSWPCASRTTARRSCGSCSTAPRSCSRTRSRFFHLSAPDLLLGMDSDPAHAQHRRPARGAPGRRSATASPCASSASRSSSGWPGARPSRRGRCRAASTRRWTAGPGTHILAELPGARPTSWRTLALWKATRRSLRGRDRHLLQRPHDVLRAWSARTASCGSTTGTCASSTRMARSSPTRSRPRTTPPGSARRRSPGLLPQGALLPAPRLSRRASTGSARWPGSTSPTAAGRRRRMPSWPSTVSASGASCRAASTTTTRGSSRPLYALERHRGAARRPGHPQPPRARPRRRQRARGRRHHRGARAACSSTTTGSMTSGAMTWANLIVATGHNNLAIGRGVHQVAKRFIDGAQDPGGRRQPRVRAGARLRSLPQLLHPLPGHGRGGAAAAGRRTAGCWTRSARSSSGHRWVPPAPARAPGTDATAVRGRAGGAHYVRHRPRRRRLPCRVG